MKKMTVLSMLLAFGLLNATSYAQSQDDIAKQFVGMWRGVYTQQRLADGTTRQNSNNVAYVFFDSNVGHMCYLSMDPHRPQWKSAAPPTADEALSALKGFSAYCASIEIHAKDGLMVRHYEISDNPNQVGGVTKRWFTFQGPNRMTLRVDTPELTAPVVESTFIWERVVK